MRAGGAYGEPFKPTDETVDGAAVAENGQECPGRTTGPQCFATRMQPWRKPAWLYSSDRTPRVSVNPADPTGWAWVNSLLSGPLPAGPACQRSSVTS